MPLHLDTPLIASPALGEAAGCDIWLKMDALQPSGSFKLRGVGAACEHHARRGKQRFVSSSGGNAGLAVAYAGQRLSIPVSVFVPETTSQHARDLIGQLGAEIIVHGASWQDANARARLSLDDTAAFIHPFDDPLLWTGHATLIDEVVRAGIAFDAVVLSVGGGGLLCGVSEGLDRNGLNHVPIVAVETRGADSLAAAIAARQPVELAGIGSIATSLGARQVSDRAFALTRERPVENVVVEDREAVASCLRFIDDHRLLVEPACGAALAVAYQRPALLSRYASVLIVVCGGATASLAQLRNWNETL